MKLSLSGRKIAVVAAVVALPLLVLPTMFLVRPPGEIRTQHLEDGSLLVLTRVKFGTSNVFIHGNLLERVLGDLIPSNGVALAGFKLRRPAKTALYGNFAYERDKPWLTAEFKVVSTNTAKFPRFNTTAGPRSLPQFVEVGSGETGIQFRIGESFPGIHGYQDGDFRYIRSSWFPRDSRRLGFRIEELMAQDGQYRTIASFRIENPAHPTYQPWVAESTPAVRMVGGVEFTLGGLTVETNRINGNDYIWSQSVDLPLRVRTNTVALTNWSAINIEAEDASGNWWRDQGVYYSNTGATNGWKVRRRDLGADPRLVWKLEIDFSPESEFPPESLHHIEVPRGLTTPLLTNVAGVPLAISWFNIRALDPNRSNAVGVKMLTNRPDLYLRFVAAHDGEDRNLDDERMRYEREPPSGFSKALLDGTTSPVVDLTIALVPIVRVTYYVQPKLVGGSGQGQPPWAQSP